MHKIKRTIADSTIEYIDRDGVERRYTTHGNIKTIEQAVAALLNAGVVNVLVKSVTVAKSVYAMDVDTFMAHAVLVGGAPSEMEVADDTDADTDDYNE